MIPDTSDCVESAANSSSIIWRCVAVSFCNAFTIRSNACSICKTSGSASACAICSQYHTVQAHWMSLQHNLRTESFDLLYTECRLLNLEFIRTLEIKYLNNLLKILTS